MKREKDFSEIFDDDFEVTYEDGWEDVPYTDSGRYSRHPEHKQKADRRHREPDHVSYDTDRDYEYEDQDSYDDEKYRGQGYDRYAEDSRSSRRRSRGGVPLAAPIRKGGRVLSRAASALVRCLTAVLILATAASVTYTFWRASTPYGDIMESLQTRKFSMTLTAYLCVAVIFLLFEFIALIWSMTKVRVRDDSGSWKEDAGRGLFSFIAVFASSYLAFLVYRFLPESPEVLYGLKGALEVYGSMHNALFGLCAAGVISCLVRKYFSR